MAKNPTGQKKASIQRNVWALGFVSLFNDIASEMVYPIIPLFLTQTLGASASIVGVIEGIAEATASVLKVFSGWFSDRFRRRKPLVTAGYTLSALSKLLLSLSGLWWQVLFARFVDRVGKGTRTSARDALIADSTDEKRRGAAFGLHRALDTTGAIIGPLLALALLHFLKEKYSTIFLIAVIPGLIGVALLIFLVREPAKTGQDLPLNLKLSLRNLSRPFKIFLWVNVLFALGNSSDAFLILRAQSLGFDAVAIVLLYVAFNLSYALFAFPIGKLADRFGARRVLILSFLYFASLYSGFGSVSEPLLLWLLFPLYGIYMAMSEGVTRAYISQIVPVAIRATAMGGFYTITGVTTFFSSFIAGLLWQYIGVSAPFYFGALMAAIAGGLFWGLRPAKTGSHLNNHESTTTS